LEYVPEELEEMNYEVLKVIPTKWIIDETEVTKNPL
jgi:cell division ATPase FtsA